MRIILITILLFTTATLFGQDVKENHHGRHHDHKHKMSHEQVESLKIAYLTKKLDLSPKEAQGFWPIYNEYSNKKRELRSSRKERHNNNIENLDEAEANALIEKHLSDKQKELDLDKSYVDQFKQVLPAKKVIMIFSLERKFKEEMLRDVKRRLNER